MIFYFETYFLILKIYVHNKTTHDMTFQPQKEQKTISHSLWLDPLFLLYFQKQQKMTLESENSPRQTLNRCHSLSHNQGISRSQMA